MAYSDVGFTKDTFDLTHLGRNMRDHEEDSQSPAIAYEIYYRWQLGLTVDSENLEEIKKATDNRRKVLRRVVDVIVTLATLRDLPLRELRLCNDDDATKLKRNFLDVIHILARYDQVLADLVKLPKHSVNYLSPQIQNELTSLISNEIKKNKGRNEEKPLCVNYI